MTKMVMTIELEYDGGVMHGDDVSARKWFIDDMIMGDDADLILHSNFICDEVGKVRVIETGVSHYADELKKLQEHNAAFAVSLQEFLYRVSVAVPFDDAEWVRDLGEEILKQLKEGPK